MRITDLLKADGIQLGAKVSTKSDAIDCLVKLHEKCGNLKDVAAYKEGILKREEMGTTAIAPVALTKRLIAVVCSAFIWCT